MVTETKIEIKEKVNSIIFPDADLSAAARAAAMAIFFNQGQVCTVGSRLYIHQNCMDEVVDSVTKIAGNLKLGNGLEPRTDLGPLISQDHFQRVSRYVDISKQEGASIITGGGPPCRS